MVPWLFLAVGLAVGTALGAGILRARSSSRLAVSEAAAGELRRQLEQIGAESSDLKARLEEEQRARVQAETLLQSEREKLQEEQNQFDEARARLSETFQGLAGEALKSNNQAFLELATRTLETLRAQGVGDLDQRKEAIQALVTPLSESLKTYAQCVHDMERRREAAYGDLKGLLTTVQATQENLQHETSNLVTALRRTSVRARWGELTLRRVVELAGMVEHCDFEQQPAVGERERLVRPDMIIRMPGGLIVPVDSKAPLDAYLDALQATSEEQRKEHLRRYAGHVRGHVAKLAAKSYEEQFASAPAFTVLFIPGEAFFSAAAEADPGLIEYAVESRILIATPVTLVALLKAVAYGWRQEKLAQSAREISNLGKQVYERASVLWDHLESLRGALTAAVNAFNKAVGSFETRLLPGIRRFRDLGATAAEPIPQLEVVEQTPRLLGALPEAGKADGENENQR